MSSVRQTYSSNNYAKRCSCCSFRTFEKAERYSLNRLCRIATMHIRIKPRSHTGGDSRPCVGGVSITTPPCNTVTLLGTIINDNIKRLARGWAWVGKRKRVTGFPLLFFSLLRFGKLAVCSVNIVVVRVTSRLVLPLCNHARNTIDEDIFQYILRLVQTRLLLARQVGRKLNETCAPFLF